MVWYGMVWYSIERRKLRFVEVYTLYIIMHIQGEMAEWSKATVLGTVLRAWVRTPLSSQSFYFG